MTVECERNAVVKKLEDYICGMELVEHKLPQPEIVAALDTQLSTLESLWSLYNLHKRNPRGLNYGLLIHDIYKGICK